MKRCGCTCHLIVKCYPNMECVLGLYKDNHTHVIGQQNAQYICLPSETHLWVAEMLHLSITHKHIVNYMLGDTLMTVINIPVQLSDIQGDLYNDCLVTGTGNSVKQDNFITSRDILKIEVSKPYLWVLSRF